MPEWLTAISLTTYVVFRIGATAYNTVAVYRAQKARKATTALLTQMLLAEQGPDTERSPAPRAHVVN